MCGGGQRATASLVVWNAPSTFSRAEPFEIAAIPVMMSRTLTPLCLSSQNMPKTFSTTSSVTAASQPFKRSVKTGFVRENSRSFCAYSFCRSDTCFVSSVVV